MKQIVYVHGGDSFQSHEGYLSNLQGINLDYERIKPHSSWKDQIIAEITDADILTPTMPNSANAQYDEWKIWFEKIIPFFDDDVRLIGHSLGAMFLAKYLHANPLAEPVRQLHLVAGGYDAQTEGYGSFAIDSAKGLGKSAIEIHLYHSKDDFVVPFEELAKFKADLPDAHIHEFENRNHFLDPEFPELIAILKRK